MSSMLFFGGIVENEHSSITQNVAVQLEPHGRLIVVGYETSRPVKIRLDGILYHPLMRLNSSPMACAPYWYLVGLIRVCSDFFPFHSFSAMEDKNNEGLGTAGCVKYCTPIQVSSIYMAILSLCRCMQYVRQTDGSMVLSSCLCDILKVLLGMMKRVALTSLRGSVLHASTMLGLMTSSVANSNR